MVTQFQLAVDLASIATVNRWLLASVTDLIAMITSTKAVQSRNRGSHQSSQLSMTHTHLVALQQDQNR